MNKDIKKFSESSLDGCDGNATCQVNGFCECTGYCVKCNEDEIFCIDCDDGIDDDVFYCDGKNHLCINCYNKRAVPIKDKRIKELEKELKELTDE